jgi:hypothetical protein
MQSAGTASAHWGKGSWKSQTARNCTRPGNLHGFHMFSCCDYEYRHRIVQIHCFERTSEELGLNLSQPGPTWPQLHPNVTTLAPTSPCAGSLNLISPTQCKMLKTTAFFRDVLVRSPKLGMRVALNWNCSWPWMDQFLDPTCAILRLNVQVWPKKAKYGLGLFK